MLNNRILGIRMVKFSMLTNEKAVTAVCTCGWNVGRAQVRSYVEALILDTELKAVVGN